MAWFSLIVAGLCETFAVAMISLFSRNKSWQTAILILIGLAAGLGLLSYALRTIPMGTGYAIWTGISVVGSALVGMLCFEETKSWQRLFFIALILCSAIGLKLAT